MTQQPRILSHEEQRQLETHRKMVGIGLHAYLLNLIREIRAGDTNKLVEFQQMIRYAPPELRLHLLTHLEETRESAR